MKHDVTQELTVIQKTYDAIRWYVPILTRLPREHKFTLGDRMINGLYDLLEVLIQAKYTHAKLPLLAPLNNRLDLLRYQTRLLLDFELIDTKRYEYAMQQLHGMGGELGNWIKQQQRRATP